MFTGLIEDVGEVVGIEALAHGSRLRIRAGSVVDGLVQGESIAVDGICLTAMGIEGNEFSADISPETIARTNMSYYTIGTTVNLERSLAIGQRLGGHFVQGHVDGISRAANSIQEGEFLRMTFTIPPGLRPYLVEKGSVALNGISLTVASFKDDTFDVALVPHTLEKTNLGVGRRAEALNMEVDILGKYVAQLLEATLATRGEVPTIGGADDVGPGSLIPGD